MSPTTRPILYVLAFLLFADPSLLAAAPGSGLPPRDGLQASAQADKDDQGKAPKRKARKRPPPPKRPRPPKPPRPRRPGGGRQTPPRKRGRDYGKKKDKKERYHVVQVGREFKVVQKSKLESFRKQVRKQFQAKLEAYKKAREKAKREGKKLERKKPLLVCKVLKGFQSEKEARSYCAELRKKAAEARDKAQKKPKKRREAGRGKRRKR